MNPNATASRVGSDTRGRAGTGDLPMPQSDALDKPSPISTGPSQAEGIAKFACRTQYADLTAERRERLKGSVLDSLACAIHALGAPSSTPHFLTKTQRKLAAFQYPLVTRS